MLSSEELLGTQGDPRPSLLQNARLSGAVDSCLIMKTIEPLETMLEILMIFYYYMAHLGEFPKVLFQKHKDLLHFQP